MANICRDGGGGYATTAPLRGSSPFCGFLQAALRLRLRLHGVNHNTPSPTALRRVEYVEHLKHPEHVKHCATR